MEARDRQAGRSSPAPRAASAARSRSGSSRTAGRCSRSISRRIRTGPGEPFAADLATREGNRAAVDAAVERFGGLDAVVANAGFQHVSPFEEFDEDRWDALVAVLLTSPFLLARYAWPHLQASGEGRIVVVASVHGLVASPFKAGYVAAKHGVIGLVKTLALEGAADGIRAVALCPGYVRTPLVERQVTRTGRAARHLGGRGAARRPPRAAGDQAS